MLIAGGTKVIGPARVSSVIAFSQRAWVGTTTRSGVTLVTRFVPAVPTPRRPGGCLYIVLRGEFSVDGTSGARSVGPAALVLSEHHMEGASGVRPITWRITGSSSETIEVHVADEDLTAPLGDEPTPIVLDEASWVAAARLVALAHTGEDAALERANVALLQALASGGIVTRRVAAEATRPLPFEKLWRAVRPMTRRFELSPTLDQLSALADASPRQLDRYMTAFFSRFGIFGGAWRTASVHLRLRIAILFLSAEGVSIAEVAKGVGYGSADAMARALRDAGADSPSAIRAALRGTPQTP